MYHSNGFAVLVFKKVLKDGLDIHIMRVLYITRRAILSGCCCYVSTCHSSFFLLLFMVKLNS